MPIHPLPGAGFAASGLVRLLQRMVPPRRIFGSPVQRAKSDGLSFWHVPITVRRRAWFLPDRIDSCRIYLDFLSGRTGSIQLRWGDAIFGETADYASLQQGEYLLVPIASRKEEAGTQAFIADSRFILGRECAHPVGPHREKIRFRLRIKTGKIEYRGDEIYRLVVPASPTNGQFILEEEYEGEGSPSAPSTLMERERIGSVTEVMGSPRTLLDSPVPAKHAGNALFEAWDQVDPLKIYEAASLWVAENPQVAPMGGTNAASIKIRILKQGILKGDLHPRENLGEVAKLRVLYDSDLIPNDWKLHRHSLKTFMDGLGEKPPFLFPESRK